MASIVKKLLIANRGEIALRVVRTAKEMGISTVAVYSEQDRNSRYVDMADEAYLLSGDTYKDTYLNEDLLIDILHKTGANAVHPGYGFLSEVPSFADKVEKAGAIWVGPHPQALIDSIQYHCETRGEYLPAASYSLVSQENGRGVYSFCMCPGGFIVPAMTDAAESVVNGMSPSGRTSPYANSGLVTEVRLADFEHLRAEWGELAGLKFQQRFEESARQRGGEHQIAPAQRVADFVAGRASGSLPRTSYIPGITPSRLDEWMPGFIAQGLRQGIATFGRRMRGYLTNEAVVVGVESRTSTPVRVPRDPGTLMHPETKGLFPAGEGAGYAGGIISAALDGERIAEAVKNYIR